MTGVRLPAAAKWSEHGFMHDKRLSLAIKRSDCWGQIVLKKDGVPASASCSPRTT